MTDGYRRHGKRPSLACICHRSRLLVHTVQQSEESCDHVWFKYGLRPPSRSLLSLPPTWSRLQPRLLLTGRTESHQDPGFSDNLSFLVQLRCHCLCFHQHPAVWGVPAPQRARLLVKVYSPGSSVVALTPLNCRRLSAGRYLALFYRGN